MKIHNLLPKFLRFQIKFFVLFLNLVIAEALEISDKILPKDKSKKEKEDMCKWIGCDIVVLTVIKKYKTPSISGIFRRN